MVWIRKSNATCTAHLIRNWQIREESKKAGALSQDPLSLLTKGPEREAFVHLRPNCQSSPCLTLHQVPTQPLHPWSRPRSPTLPNRRQTRPRNPQIRTTASADAMPPKVSLKSSLSPVLATFTPRRCAFATGSSTISRRLPRASASRYENCDMINSRISIYILCLYLAHFEQNLIVLGSNAPYECIPLFDTAVGLNRNTIAPFWSWPIFTSAKQVKTLRNRCTTSRTRINTK